MSEEIIFKKVYKWKPMLTRRLGRPKNRWEYDIRSDIINYIKAQRLSWFGHLHRMSEEIIFKKVYKWKLMLTRRLGRPKNRWEYDIRSDMKKLKIKNWTSCIQDRNNWKLHVEKAKTFND
jgi:hypothetical protein